MDKADLSLDDIIKLNKKASGRGNSDKKPNLKRLKSLGARSGIIRKGGSKQIGGRPQPTIQKKEPTRLHISNLHYNVSDKDLHELFSEIGTVKKAAVHYDKSGRSIGTAEVILTSREQAVKAIKKYNNVPLDGRTMNITLVPSQTNIRSPTKSRIGVKPNSGIHKGPKGRNVPKGRLVNARDRKPNFRGQRPIKKENKKEVTAEQLDADLEAYREAEN